MFKVVNEFGNVQFTLKTEKERDYYLRHGYKEVSEGKKLPKKEGEAKNATRKGKARTERDI